MMPEILNDWKTGSVGQCKNIDASGSDGEQVDQSAPSAPPSWSQAWQHCNCTTTPSYAVHTARSKRVTILAFIALNLFELKVRQRDNFPGAFCSFAPRSQITLIVPQ
jgi:hypothetical protein